jgi:hypothetical protein
VKTRGAWVACILTTLVACIDLSTDPDEIVAIEFGDFPWPSLVAGDTFRNELGVASPLKARLFNTEGDEVAGAPVEFLSRDTTVTITPAGFLIADTGVSGAVRVFASGPGVQSIVRSVEIVRRPDSLALNGTLPDTLKWVIIDNAATNTTADIQVRLLSYSDDSTETFGVGSWVVSYRLEFQGAAVQPGDTTRVFLVNDNGIHSVVDTTNPQGIAGRRVRLKAGASIPTEVDSVIVFAEAKYRGVPVKDAPIRMVLRIRPQ